ncbi:MAG TPA: hypothetical protein VGL40_06860 [Bacillota bacterium]
MPKGHITQRELLQLEDCIGINEILVKKGEFFAGLVQETTAKEMIERHGKEHERHIQDLVQYIKSSTPNMQ